MKDNIPLYSKNIDEVDTSTLSELYGIEEGWYYEFKSIAPDNIKIARSICSFANAYGGVLIFGIIEHQKSRRLSEIKGFSENEANEIVLKVRQSVEAHLVPCPFYAIKIVRTTDLNEEKFIVWVKIYKGDNGPYLHSSGMVYTRKGDSSSPISLNDIGQFERMWQNSRKRNEILSQRINYLSNITNKKIPRIELYISAKKKPHELKNDITINEFKEIAFGTDKRGSRNLFDSVYPMDKSFVARLNNNDLNCEGLLWDYDYKNELHHIRIPLATQEWNGSEFDSSSHSWQSFTRLKEFFIKKKFRQKIFIIDYTKSLGIICEMLTKVYNLSLLEGCENELYLNAKVSGVKNSFPFIDLKRYYDELDSGIIPFVYRELDYLYSLQDQESWLKLNYNAINYTGPATRDFDNTAAIVIRILKQVGITLYVSIGKRNGNSEDPKDIEPQALGDLIIQQLTEPCKFTAAYNPYL